MGDRTNDKTTKSNKNTIKRQKRRQNRKLKAVIASITSDAVKTLIKQTAHNLHQCFDHIEYTESTVNTQQSNSNSKHKSRNYKKVGFNTSDFEFVDFEIVPDNCWIKIFESWNPRFITGDDDYYNLNLREAVSIRLVCKRFKNLINASFVGCINYRCGITFAMLFAFLTERHIYAIENLYCACERHTCSCCGRVSVVSEYGHVCCEDDHCTNCGKCEPHCRCIESVSSDDDYKERCFDCGKFHFTRDPCEEEPDEPDEPDESSYSSD